MAIPHIIFKQQAKKRLEGKAGSEKIKEIRKLIAELPGYRTGPYGEIRKWLKAELAEAKVRKSSTRREWFAVEKKGDAQVAIVGAPNAGKSSLLRALTAVQTKVAPYAFTTLKPVPAICDIYGAQVQLVEVPGLIEGAHEGRGMGRKLLSVAKGADFVIVVCSLADGPEELRKILAEIRAVGIADIRLVAANKSDLPDSRRSLDAINAQFANVAVLPVSAVTGEGLHELKMKIWEMLGLIRIFPKDKNGIASEKPILLPVQSTIKELALKIHGEMLEHVTCAAIWGPSGKFPGQEVGLEHRLEDGDVVQLR